jgi:cytochrome c556
MVRKFIRASLFCALGAMAMVLSFGAAVTTAQDKKKTDKKDEKKTEELPSISDIMAKAHGKTDGYIAQLRANVKGEKWEDAGKLTKDFALVADALAKNKPPKGDAKSWETQTKKYIGQVKTVSDAVEKKDAKATTAGLDAIQKSCGGCHGPHKPK